MTVHWRGIVIPEIAHQAVVLVCWIGLLIVGAGCTSTARPDAEIPPKQAVTEEKVDNCSPLCQGPLRDILTAVLALDITEEESLRQLQDAENQREEFMAKCMAEKGFAYIPNPEILTPLPPSEFHFDNRDWVSQYGYGLANSPSSTNADPIPVPVDTNPNTPIVDSLSATELEAYHLALNGDEGCRSLAWQHVFSTGLSGLRQSDEFAPLFAALSEMQTRVLRIEISDAERDWATCMADAGYPGFERWFDPAQAISEAWTEWHMSLDWENWDGRSPMATNDPELAALQEREIEMALADFDCRVVVNFDARQAARQLEAETQFYHDHQAELKALQSAAEQLG